MDWETFHKETKRLAKLIGVKPDIVVAIARGGAIPATVLAKLLDVKEMFLLSMHRDGAKRTITTNVTADVAGKRILLVEDMIETGQALIAGKRYLENLGASVQTACLYTMSMSEMNPDYCLKGVSETVQFPWNDSGT